MSKAGAPQRRRVYLVDDHPLVREWLANMISLEADLEICGQAAEVSAALAEVRTARPDIVVADLSMPRGSGLELIKDLRARFPAIRLLVLSMLDEAGVAERAFRAGANGYAIKRESGPKIVEAIRSVLEGKFYASASLAAELAGRMFGASRTPEDLLSDREMEVFRLRGQGRSTKEIGGFLRVSVKTVGSYETRIKEKLGLANSGTLLREAIRWNDRRSGV